MGKKHKPNMIVRVSLLLNDLMDSVTMKIGYTIS